MEISEYKERLKKLDEDHQRLRQNLMIDFALSQAKFKMGDIIKEIDKLIKIDKITVYISSVNLPVPVYHGYELKKDLTPKVNKSRNSIYGNGYENCPVTLIQRG